MGCFLLACVLENQKVDEENVIWDDRFADALGALGYLIMTRDVVAVRIGVVNPLSTRYVFAAVVFRCRWRAGKLKDCRAGAFSSLLPARLSLPPPEHLSSPSYKRALGCQAKGCVVEDRRGYLPPHAPFYRRGPSP